ncbi:pteridine reductase [Parachitinimonas caeni]|uniref:Pteridine reductase n=1 Tax=Parachitinimonas caeni TaxID=3031301 RepID=A0ABT7E4F3_9NEIS|nr:pteridine reductase [Parachitinimonas caeni]MDK2126310.1 pteridine reductase [Parachitinimonas caeni]
MENQAAGQEKVALITGGAKRIGAAIVRELHEAGINIMLHYRSSSAEARALAAELNLKRPNSIATVQADLLNMGGLPSLVQQTIQHFGRLDIVVNNASSFFPTPIGEVTEESWQDLVGSNLKAPLFLIQAAAGELKKRQGCVINMVDIHAERPMRHHVVYSVAKAGLVAMTRALARDLGPDVRVNAVAPGANVWPDGESVFDDVSRQRIISSIPLKRVGEPIDIARTIRFLVMDAPYITGQIIAVDGGRSLNL